MVSDRLRKSVAPGRSIIVATADADGVPTACRGIALKTDNDFETVTLYVPVATSHETMANIATTRRIAIGSSEIATHETVQIKGLTRGVRLAPPSDESFVRERLEALAATLGDIGLPRRVTRSFTHWPAFAIDVSIEEVFDQTPGPKAGTPIP